MRDFRFGQIDLYVFGIIICCQCSCFNCVLFIFTDIQANTMNYKKAFSNNFEKLLTLPMDDSTFIAKLATSNLLPGDTGRKIEAQSTPADKASCFLNRIIKSSLDADNIDSFNKLLSVMEQCEYDHIKQLALEIKSAIEGTVMHIIWLLISFMCIYVHVCMCVSY